MYKNVIKVSIVSTSALAMLMSMIAGLSIDKWTGTPVYSYHKAYLGILFASIVFLLILSFRKLGIKWYDTLHKENFQARSVFALLVFSVLVGVGISLNLISVLT